MKWEGLERSVDGNPVGKLIRKIDSRGVARCQLCQKYINSPPVFSEVRLTRSLVLCVMFCRLLLYPRSPKGERGILFYLCPSVLPSVQDIFRRIFLSNCWWQKSDIWSQASYRYTILWVAFLDPSDSYFLFADLVGFYTYWTYMHIFRHNFLNNYWWQISDIWSQASYRYPISWEAFLNPSDSYFLFDEERGYHRWAHSSSCLSFFFCPLCCLSFDLWILITLWFLQTLLTLGEVGEVWNSTWKKTHLDNLKIRKKNHSLSGKYYFPFIYEKLLSIFLAKRYVVVG